MKFTDADERAFAVLDAVSADIEQQGGRPDSMNVREHEQIKQAIEHLRVRLAADQQKGGGELCPDCGDRVDQNPDENGETRCADCWITHRRATSPQPSIPAPAERADEVHADALRIIDRNWFDHVDGPPAQQEVGDVEAVEFRAAFFVSRDGNRVEQLTSYEDYRSDGALLRLMDLGQKRASAKKLTKKGGGKVVLSWIGAALANQPHADQETQG